MKNKVTSYELSKRLDELKFECESHTGWWHDSEQCDLMPLYYKVKYDTTDLKVFGIKHYKAYDLYDLVRSKYLEGEAPLNLLFTTKQDDLVLYGYDSLDTSIDNLETEPQNALAQAVVKILESKVSE